MTKGDRHARGSRAGVGPWIAAAGLALALGSGAPGGTAAAALGAGGEVIASWGFDEPSGAVLHDTSGAGHDALDTRPGAKAPGRALGVRGRALSLAGAHALGTRGGDLFGDLGELSISAWVRPEELGGYREIFRKEDGDRRVLFSFQAGGTILSLGLNVGGYVECDAPVEPALLLDGSWHHCAGTFDGDSFRVYLDGEEVGSLRRVGRVTTGHRARAFIGSSGGASEQFQGEIDELELRGRAPGAAEIAVRYRAGIASLSRQLARVRRRAAELYVRAGTFARTFAGLRRRLEAAGIEPDRDLAGLLLSRLRSDFPREYRGAIATAGAGPRELLTARGREAISRKVERLMALLVEYRPLTPSQWACQGPAERSHWEEVAEIEERWKRLREASRRESGSGSRSGAAGVDGADWIELLLAVAERVRLRPRLSEPVAPYVPARTPETRDLTAREAREALERDWLHQCGANPAASRIRDEIRWARELAARIAPPGSGLDLSAELRELDRLERRAESLERFDRELYLAVRRAKRAIALRNPVVDFDRVLFVDMPYPQGSEWRHQTRHRLGYMAVPGARLLVLEGLSPAGRLRQLMPRAPLHGSFWRPDLSWDARKVLVSFKAHNEKSFHLWEVGVDGRDPVQLTRGPYDDLDPIYLPDGRHIVFSTTRGHSYVRCMPPTNAFVLARSKRDGSEIFLISRNNEPDYLPAVLADGRIAYTRWEYTDKPLWRAQGLWTVNPDGTDVMTLWGNQSVWPDLLKDARGIPGSRRIMFTGSAHHDWFSGSVGIIDPAAGFNFPEGLTKVTADVPWPESGNGPVDPVESPDYHSSGSYNAYYSPYPLGEEDFLVSASRGGKFVLYLMDVHGNRELVYEGAHNIFHAIPVKPRRRPPVIADRVAWPRPEERDRPEGGVIFSRDVYEGAPPEIAGKARYLRVLSLDAKTYTYWNKRPYISTGPVVSLVQSEGVKRVLGTVPIERDGSVSFRAPSGVPLHFQLLDERYRALHTMRSFTGVMPGEYRGCQGCHESHSRAPAARDPRSLAAARPPRAIDPPPWKDRTVSYVRYVKPVLERYCGDCHIRDAKGREAFDLTPRAGFLGFERPYVVLTGRPSWGRPYQPPANPPGGWGLAGVLMVEAYGQRDPKAYTTPPPMRGLSSTSPLVRMASSGEHHGARADPVSLRRLSVWVDTLCPYRGDEEVRQIADPEFQGVDWLAIRPLIHSAPRVVRPGPVD